MFPPHRGELAGAIREDSTGFVQQMSQEAKEYESAQYGQEDAHRTFVALSVPKKLVVMLGGPVMNLLISIVLMTVMVSGIGLPAVTQPVQSVSECVMPDDVPEAFCYEGTSVAPPPASEVPPG